MDIVKSINRVLGRGLSSEEKADKLEKKLQRAISANDQKKQFLFFVRNSGFY